MEKDKKQQPEKQKLPQEKPYPGDSEWAKPPPKTTLLTNSMDNENPNRIILNDSKVPDIDKK